MSIEDRLRSALRTEADDITPTDEGWTAIEQRASGVRRHRTLRNAGLSVLLVAAAVTAVIALPVLDTDPGERVTVGTQPGTAPAATSTTTAELTMGGAVWDGTFLSSEEAAQSFAKDYLQMPSPVVVASNVESQYLVRAKPGRGPFTRIFTASEQGLWFVTGAASDNLQLASPQPDDVVTSPVTLQGKSTAYEATVAVRIREFPNLDRGDLAFTHFTGGGAGEALEPFRASVRFRKPQAGRGVLELLIYSAEDGTVSEATVVPIRF